MGTHKKECVNAQAIVQRREKKESIYLWLVVSFEWSVKWQAEKLKNNTHDTYDVPESNHTKVQTEKENQIRGEGSLSKRDQMLVNQWRNTYKNL